MKAITVQQPWARAIIHAGKNIENRTRLSTWKRAEGQRIAIHAGRRWSDRGAGHYLIVDGYRHGVQPRSTGIEFAFGAIIGTVLVSEVHWADDECDPDICGLWGETSYLEDGGATRTSIVHLVLEAPRPLIDPVPCTGALGLWTVDDRAAREIEAVTAR